MSDLNQILSLWQSAKAAGEEYVLASIVRVEGSSYRKPGARMIVTRDGRRAGTISGGCLEAEVTRQAWWLTENGPVVKAYSTSFETDNNADAVDVIERPYGLGCGGVVYLLLERRATAELFLEQASAASEARTPLACAVVLEGANIGRRAFAADKDAAPAQAEPLCRLAANAIEERQSSMHASSLEDATNEACIWAEYLPPRCGLFLFGAGDDAQPLVIQAATLGWQITVADGRSHLATAARFPDAHRVTTLKDSSLGGIQLHPGDAAVVMTHSFEQDSCLLTQLLPMPLLYLGVLGPRYRTADLVEHAARKIGGSASGWMQRLHAPVGFNLGSDSPATIALSILAEIQATLRHVPGPALLRGAQTALPMNEKQPYTTGKPRFRNYPRTKI